MLTNRPPARSTGGESTLTEQWHKLTNGDTEDARRFWGTAEEAEARAARDSEWRDTWTATPATPAEAEAFGEGAQRTADELAGEARDIAYAEDGGAWEQQNDRYAKRAFDDDSFI